MHASTALTLPARRRKTPRQTGRLRLCWLFFFLTMSALPSSSHGQTAPHSSASGVPRIDTAVVRDYLPRIEADLRGNILPFWLKHTRDRERGGFFNEITNDLVVDKNAPRGALLTARILWTFSAAYRRYHDAAYLEMARWAFDDLTKHFWDPASGGTYWSISADGKPLDTRKVVYGQVFDVYALTEFYRATNEQAALDRALEIYRTVEARAHDHQHRGYKEEFTREWQWIEGRSAMDATGPKSQNAHLHILEAYTNLLRVWPDPELKKNLRELIDVLLTHILNSADHHLRLFLSVDWKPMSETISFGHDIEFSWLLVEAAEVLGDPDVLARAEASAVAIARVTAAEGVDRDGGVYDEAEEHKGLTDSRKEWWPQAEAAVGFLGAYRLSGDKSYLQHALASWDFIEQHLIDRKNGEWLRGITRDGAVLPRYNKVSFWKCPYHNSRACMELIDRLSAMSTRE
jgi:mannobiose 2-epimerase